MKKILLLIFSIITSTINAQNWDELQKITTSDRASNDWFGWSVSISGNYAILGAYRENEGWPASSDGAAYIYEKDNVGNWNEAQKLIPSDRESNDRFGFAVSIVDNGISAYAIVSATFHDDLDGNGDLTIQGGAAYIFERNTGTGIWEEKIKIRSDDVDSWDYFGYSVAITAVGAKGYAIVGAYLEDDGVFLEEDKGAAYLFERDEAGNWGQVQKITSDVRKAGDNFGQSVAINATVNNMDTIVYAVVGAPLEDDGLNDTNDEGSTAAGSAYIFSRNGGGTWNQIQKIIASDWDANDSDWFGYSINMSEATIVVGAWNDDHDVNGDNPATEAGSAYIFEKNNTGMWVWAQKITAPERGITDAFGSAVDVSGNTIVVGAYREAEDANEDNTIGTAGSAYIFEKGNSAEWTLSQKITAPEREGTDYFGWAAGISGNQVLVAAYREDEDSLEANKLADAGSAYIFQKATTCNTPDMPTLSATNPTVCSGTTVTLSINSGDVLNDATNWQWYTNSCGGTPLGTDASINVSPEITTTYFVRGEGNCVTPGSCSNITITVPEPLELSVVITNEILGNDGTIDLAVSGGILPYTFDWDNDGTGDFDDTEDLTALTAGTYVVIVKDSLACEATLNVVVENTTCNAPDVPTSTATNSTICSGSAVTISLDMGNQLNDAANWQWYTNSCGGTPLGTGTSIDVSPEITTTYFVRGEGNCVTPGSCSSITITVPEPLELSVVITNEVLGNDGTIDLAVSGGILPYTFDWDNDGTGDFDDTEDLTTLAAGTYVVIVRDSLACEETINVVVEEKIVTGFIEQDEKLALSIYPNPSQDGMVNIDILEGEKAILNIRNSEGKFIAKYIIYNKIKLEVNSLPKGLYFFEFMIKEQKVIKLFMNK